MNTQTAYLLLLAFLLRHLDELPLELWDQVLHTDSAAKTRAPRK